MRESLDTYENLLKAAKVYRNAMMALATATSEFASALEDCARQKGAAYTPQPSTSKHPVGLPENIPGLDSEETVHDASAEEETGPTTSPSERLMAAAGLHHVMSNQQQLLVSYDMSDHSAIMPTDDALRRIPFSVRHLLQIF